METLLDKVQPPQGEIIVTTKTPFFGKPHTSVMPYGFSQFGRQLGFQAVYRTSDPAILKEFHDCWIAMIMVGGFQAYLAGAKMGFVDFPPDFKHLLKYIFGFHA